MRLINIEDEPLLKTVSAGGLSAKALWRLIKSQRTIKAIPIEWILKRAKLCTADYANCLHYLVEAWETEQKYMVNGQWKFPKDGEKENEELV